jgi:hypothetical protein
VRSIAHGEILCIGRNLTKSCASRIDWFLRHVGIGSKIANYTVIQLTVVGKRIASVIRRKRMDTETRNGFIQSVRPA